MKVEPTTLQIHLLEILVAVQVKEVVLSIVIVCSLLDLCVHKIGF